MGSVVIVGSSSGIIMDSQLPATPGSIGHEGKTNLGADFIVSAVSIPTDQPGKFLLSFKE